MQKIHKNKIYIFIFLLFAAVVLTTALNWKHIINIGVTPQDYVSVHDSESPYQISVYYFPTRKSAAQALAYYFSEQGYLVETKAASTLKSLKSAKFSPSHIFYNHEDMIQAMGIKKKIEKIVGYPVNAYKFHVSQSSPSMMIVFTDQI
jgi:hypothetical protein